MSRLWGWIGVILVILCGCQQRSAVGPTINLLAGRDFDVTRYPAIAFIGLGKAVPQENVIEIMEPLVEERLATERLGTVILTRAEVERRAQSSAAQALRDVRDYWRDDKKIDEFRLRALCKAIDVQAVILGSVEDWTRSEVSWGAEGTSFTRVALSLYVFSEDDVHPLWHARGTQMLESREHEPSEIYAGRQDPGSERATPRAGSEDPATRARVERAQKAVPDAPPLEEVGRSVIAALVQRLAGTAAK